MHVDQKYSDTDTMKQLVGHKVLAIRMNDDYLSFITEGPEIAFTVYGDCCSHSYFHDFHGVEKLLDNGPVLATYSVELDPGDPGWYDEGSEKAAAKAQWLGANPGKALPKYEWDWWEGEGGYIQVYGYSIVTEHPFFGEQTSTFSFRNSSNGYYGGSLATTSVNKDILALPILTSSVVVGS